MYWRLDVPQHQWSLDLQGNLKLYSEIFSKGYFFYLICGGILIQNRNLLLCSIVLIVCDCMVYPDSKFLIFRTKKHPRFFLSLEADFFDPMLSRKTFATNSLK